MQSLPVVIIRCEENEINQLDFRIQTDNIRCFILLSGLRKLSTGFGHWLSKFWWQASHWWRSWHQQDYWNPWTRNSSSHEVDLGPSICTFCKLSRWSRLGNGKISLKFSLIRGPQKFCLLCLKIFDAISSQRVGSILHV